MTAQEMHYDFKQKFNRLDSQGNRDFLVPELDWKLNEAQEVFVKIVAQPRLASELGLEVNQRTIDDIRTIVINQKESEGITPTVFDEKSYLVALPADYWFFIGAEVKVTKGNCTAKLDAVVAQHNDAHERSPFNQSSFLWRKSNIRFISSGIRVFTDGVFKVEKFIMDYLKKPPYIHNAQDWEGGSYQTLSGVTLTGTQPCILPEGTHREIVDLAVLIAAGDLGLSDFNLKRTKINLTNS
jgi:hypothetical protein